MSLVPYAPVSNKRYRSDQNYESNNMAIVPYVRQRSMVAYSGMARRGYNTLANNSRRRYYRKFIVNTRTNPVYPRPEVKFKDTYLGTNAVGLPIDNTGAQITLLNDIPQGTASQNRIGMQIALKNCYYQFVINIGTTTAPIVVRHILFWDRQPNGGTPPTVSGDLLSNSNALVASPLALRNRNRFTIIADERITLSPNGDQIRIIEGFRTINQLSTYADAVNIPQTGALYVVLVSDEPSGATAPTFYGSWRTRFLDN